MGEDGHQEEAHVLLQIQTFGTISRIRFEHPHFVDFIEFSLTPIKIKPAIIANLYLNEGLSAGQIAQKLDIAKSTVLKRLHSLDIRNKKFPTTDPQNYRRKIPPYGFRIVDGRQLVPYKKEINICRLVVRGIEDKKLSCHAMARELEKKGIKNTRTNGPHWSQKTISSIYKRWQGKI